MAAISRSPPLAGFFNHPAFITPHRGIFHLHCVLYEHDPGISKTRFSYRLDAAGGLCFARPPAQRSINMSDRNDLLLHGLRWPGTTLCLCRQGCT